MAARGYAGTYLSVSDLISVLPPDYMVIIKNGKDVMDQGVVWVLKQYEWKMEEARHWDVLSMETNFNNDEVTIRAGYHVAR